MFWKFKIPTAMPVLGIGLNQAIMACLNMVIIASMIGSGGLGYLVLTALRRLDFGAALEAGLAIVVLAVVCDRLGQAAAQRLATGRTLSQSGMPYGRLALCWTITATGLALFVPLFQTWPEAIKVTTAPLWNGLVSWINIHWFDVLDGIRSFTLLNLMNPAKNFMLSVPWAVVVGLLSAAGFALGGLNLAARVAGLALFVLVTGFWDPAIVSVYLVTLGTVVSLLIGMPIGYAIALKPSWRAPMDFALDTLQTLPTLVYILPAVMLFRNGDFSAVLAIISYAVAPAIRYAMHGFASVPATRIEAIKMCGANSWQTRSNGCDFHPHSRYSCWVSIRR
jgi:glycine betaine/proline transport system permease protein